MRTFAMRQYAAAYFDLVAVFVYTIVLFILPELDSPDTAGFLPIFVALGIAIALAALAVSLWRGAPRRPWLWIVALVPAVLFLLMNAIYLPYALTHPSDPAFTVALVLVVGVGVLVVTGVVAFREARAGADDLSGRRGRMTSAIVWAAVVGAVVTSNIAAGAGSGGASVAEAPTSSALLTAENTAFAETGIEIQAGEVLGLFIVNRDGYAHSFDIDALDIHVQLPANATIAATIKPTGPGRLDYYCAVPGHREAGMVGSLTVGP